MTRVTLGHTEWNIEYDAERDTIILSGRGPMPRDYALSLADLPEHDSAQTQSDQHPTEVEVSATKLHSTPESNVHRISRSVAFVDVRSVVLTPIECDIREALHLARALLSHSQLSKSASHLRIEDVCNLVAQIEAAVEAYEAATDPTNDPHEAVEDPTNDQ